MTNPFNVAIDNLRKHGIIRDKMEKINLNNPYCVAHILSEQMMFNAFPDSHIRCNCSVCNQAIEKKVNQDERDVFSRRYELLKMAYARTQKAQSDEEYLANLRLLTLACAEFLLDPYEKSLGDKNELD